MLEATEKNCVSCWRSFTDARSVYLQCNQAKNGECVDGSMFKGLPIISLWDKSKHVANDLKHHDAGVTYIGRHEA